MFASIRNAGLSRSAPVSKFVIVASQMSRSSKERPIDSSAIEVRALLGPALEDRRQLVVPVEPVEGNLGHSRTLRGELGDERPGVERIEADPRGDLLAGRASFPR